MENQLIKQTLKNHDSFRLPSYLTRVTAGTGGEAFLIFTEEKVILHDCGMAYCYQGLIEHIEKALVAHHRDRLDYILLSHSHYDHVGALPYVLKRWPEAEVFGAEKAAKVFRSEGARATMKRLGEAARNAYCDSSEPVLTEGLRVDHCLTDGQVITAGGVGEEIQTITAIATPGHTDCSYSYMLNPAGLMFTSESTGIPRPFGDLHTSILKNYHHTIESAEKCRGYQPKMLLIPHYGMLPDQLIDEYFDIYIDFAEYEKNLIINLYDKGYDFQQIMNAYESKYWSADRGKAQPKEAFLENAKYIVKHILEVFRHA